MGAYGAILRVHIGRLLQYRAAAVAGFATQLFWGLIRAMIFTAFYRSTSQVQPMSHGQVISYVWLGQAFLLLIPFRPDPDIASLIRTGGVAYELLRPLDVYASWYARCLAARVAPVLLRCVPMLVTAGLLLGLSPPAGPEAAVLWVVSTAAAMLLSAAFAALVTITLLWTLSGEGAARILPSLSWMFCGIVLPLPLLPDWSQRVVALLPFRGMLDTPLRIYVGHLAGAEALVALAHQGLWTIALFALGHWLVSRSLARVIVQGG